MGTFNQAASDLYAFIHAAVSGIVDKSDAVKIELIESGIRTVTLIIHCDTDDLKFIYSRAKAIKFIAIAIAQRHKVIVNLIIND